MWYLAFVNWEILDQLLASVDGAPTVDRVEPGPALRALEELADTRPTDRVLASAIRALEGGVSGAPRAGTDEGGVHRGALLAWDPWTLTWIGTDIDTGSEAVLRELRPDVATPVRQRALVRDGRALEGLVDGLRVGDGWLAAPLPGTVLPAHPSEDPEHVARWMGTALVQLRRFEERELWPVSSPEQWRMTDTGVRIVALDLTHRSDPGPVLAQLSRFLLPEGVDQDSAVLDVLSAFTQVPPTSVADAIEALERAMATDLAARRHELFDRRRRTARSDRAARLLAALQGLRDALPPPEGRGALGVDMEGRTLVVEGRPEGLWWGPTGEMAPVWTPEDGFDAPSARRLLRTRAAAPSSERLNTEVDGDARVADAIGRWVAAALRARTVRLLLEKELERA